MATDTTSPDSVTLARDARLFRESLSKCRRDVSCPLKDEHVRNLLKRMENDRVRSCEHIVTVMRDAFDRKAPRADVEGPAHRLLAIVDAWYRAGQHVRGDLPTLLRRMREAEAIGGMAEVELALDPSPKVIADSADALRRELTVLEQLIRTCEAETVERQRQVA